MNDLLAFAVFGAYALMLSGICIYARYGKETD
jgi:hypothetical protein